MIMTQRLRLFLFANSDTMAFVEASIPPIPKPVMKRMINSVITLSTNAAPNMPAVISTRQNCIVGLRPNLSAMPPRKIEPKAIPTSSMASTTPSSARLIPHSAAIPGEAKLIARTSKPSSALREIQMIIATHCTGLSLESSRIAVKDIVTIL